MRQGDMRYLKRIYPQVFFAGHRIQRHWIRADQQSVRFFRFVGQYADCINDRQVGFAYPHQIGNHFVKVRAASIMENFTVLDEPHPVFQARRNSYAADPLLGDWHIYQHVGIQCLGGEFSGSLSIGIGNVDARKVPDAVSFAASRFCFA